MTIPKLKKAIWRHMSKYIRLRDTQDGYGNCCTCGSVKHWKKADAGHFLPRGSGGSSGVYFDERNVHLQCKQCNAFKQGAPEEYELFMVNKYGQEVINELRIKHKTFRYSRMDLEGLLLYYKAKDKEYEERNI